MTGGRDDLENYRHRARDERVGMDRRGFLTGMAGILAAGAAPAIITTPGLLMPIRKIIVPSQVMALGAWSVEYDGPSLSLGEMIREIYSTAGIPLHQFIQPSLRGEGVR